ncbi:type II toxin-antitoxin system HipA family toxin [Acidithiobacillus caldus]|uniref:HipA domain-containing protein n=2 Tax=Acidithiobacillus caldus TaxID=33059 RepID=UPI000CD35032|nr:HipA domain-containing protein [Acidithiobacillus caldus]AUW32138.1 type II toxin-antitoxin system HipA family toxin [Acidithiobacillus caldus]
MFRDVVVRLRATPLAKAWGSETPETELRISIAGAQEKTALLWWDGQWQIPLGTTPTTHILKLPLGRIGVHGLDLRQSLENEWLCLKILEAFGLAVPKAELLNFDGVQTLAVERFDSRIAQSGTWIWRLPQEDLCQATGTSPLHKYESDGGPGMGKILELLALSTESRRDRRHFILAQILFWLLRAPDGHAKNFSIYLHPGGAFELTPMYDVMSAYPVLGGNSGQIPVQKVKMAMAVRTPKAHSKMQDILARHWLEMARLQGMTDDAQSILDDLSARGPGILTEIGRSLPAGFPAKVAEPILDGMLTAIRTKLG